MYDPTPRRFAIEITEQQYQSLSVLEHGMRKQIFTLILDSLIDLFTRHSPSVVIGALIEKSIGVKEICKLELKEK